MGVKITRQSILDKALAIHRGGPNYVTRCRYWRWGRWPDHRCAAGPGWAERDGIGGPHLSWRLRRNLLSQRLSLRCRGYAGRRLLSWWAHGQGCTSCGNRYLARPPNQPGPDHHLPDGTMVTRWTNQQRREERHSVFGTQADPFWRWQERTADALWALALRMPPWPPQTAKEVIKLGATGLAWLANEMGRGSIETHILPQLAADALRPVAAHLQGASGRLRLFVDAQLLIAAQTTSLYTNALYGAAALDLPRRGVVHLKGGMGAIAQKLAQAVHQNGGQVLYRQEVVRIVMEKGQPVAVETKRGESFIANIVVANLPPWDIARLLGDDSTRRLCSLPPRPKDGWGAFMVYVGLDGSAIPPDFPLHHQVVVGEPLAEGNSVFLSLSPAWDRERGPAGQRALTLSTHTQLGPWWDVFARDRSTYETLKVAYTRRMMDAAQIVLPSLPEAASLTLPGTPITFQRFTRRAWGWVGGFPQTNLFRAWGPRLAPGLWMVGDSIFPGQSTAAVALGGMRVAHMILGEGGLEAGEWHWHSPRISQTRAALQ